ncbi:MAG TPA: hypothetical protein PLM53_09160 [Spirochaetota bacterium]|nr:hypothetical protein [Spirochaetota bacterium]HPC40104.1 hypothetical protein [Spirochaetota bacterium]HPL15848.1 hypothetical protein [Spirochaetota bacterium]HQF08508.1 hypothetical protein [Spirochaetota bacterium]HQH97255.1 hypothetical protein [Spirochaetota bacterium]
MNMHPHKLYLLLINLVGGAAVLASYVIGIMNHPETRGALWGEVPRAIMPVYTISMFTAAAGYLAFTYFIMFRLNPDGATIAGHFSYGLFPWLYALVLVPSALWMPLTFVMLGNPSRICWIGIRAVLGITGIASLLLLGALITVQPAAPVWAHRLAVIGCAAFCVQTALLDALVWTAYFPTN